MSARQAWGRAGLVMAAVLVVDQVTKHLVRSNVLEGDRNNVFFGIDIVHVRNHGVAFGAFAGGGTIVALIIAAALVALVVWFVRHTGTPLAWLPVGLLLGGAIGNIFDRIRDGAVTDFIKFPAWPAFNVADIAITFGVLSLLYVLEAGGGSEGDGD